MNINKYFIISILLGFCLVGCFSNKCQCNREALEPNTDDYFEAIIETKDEDFVLFGYERASSGTNNTHQNYLLKLDKKGNKIWKTSFKHKQPQSKAYSKDFVQTADGGFVVPSEYDPIIIKFDKDGNQVFEKKINDYTQGGLYQLQRFIQTNDGNFVLFIASKSSTELLKLDKNGNELWKKKIDHIKDITKVSTGTGNVAVMGFTKKADDYLYFIKLLDKNSNQLWEKDFTLKHPYHRDFFETADGGFVLPVLSGYQDTVVIIKLDKEVKKVDKLWEKQITNYQDIIQTADKGFLISYKVLDTDNVYLNLIKLDKDGNVLWRGDKKTITTTRMDFETSITTKDSGFMFVGYRTKKNNSGFKLEHKDAFAVKLDKDGNKLWEKTFPSTYKYCPNYENDITICGF